MKKYIPMFAVLAISLASHAVPARRVFHDYPSEDGTTVQLTLSGDEYAHWYEDARGIVYRKNADGTFVRAEITRAESGAMRKASPKYQTTVRRAKQEFCNTPNMAPRGIVIIVNFSDTKLKSSHTLSVFDELCNSAECTVNEGYPSAGQYFADQSNGAYRPQFDVFGPVTLSKGYAYYGNNVGYGDNAEDEYATDAVIEACILANSQYSDLNFANYDSDNDGKVDFVYVIYAGKGEADSGIDATIWPHNWSIQTLVTYFPNDTYYSKSDTKLDGVYLDNYAMSNEIDALSGAMCGIGTLCHEFGHVMGLPDFYDTSYSTNYDNQLTPNEWDVMDVGAYNANGHCPPNYSPWEKYFFGWHTPVNLGNGGEVLELIANGKEGYQAYQINSGGKLVTPTTAGECYYIENRQAQGWDKPLSGHGMLIWKMNYSESAWANNKPNNTANKPLYTIVSAYGSKIGDSYMARNTYPGSYMVTSATVAGKPLKNITETNGVISLVYIEKPVNPFDITWITNGQEFATTTSKGTVVFPATEPEACGEDYVFVGWCTVADYASETTAPSMVAEGEPVEEEAVFYAVFAEVESEGDKAVEDKLTLTTTGVSGNSYTAWNGKTVNSTAVYAGNNAGSYSSIQLRSKNKNSGIVTTASGGKLSKVTVDWNSNTATDRVLDVYGKNTPYTDATDLYTSSGKGTKIGSIAYGNTELEITGDYTYVGICSNNASLYLNSVTFTWGGGVSYTNYTTACPKSDETIFSSAVAGQPRAVKAIRNGAVVIIRGGEVFNLLGVRL